MTIMEGVKTLKGRPAFIPDVTRLDLPQFLVDMGYKVGAEIGVHKGRYTEKFCEVGLKMYAVDPWRGFSGQGRSQQRQEQQDEVYNKAVRVLSRFPSCEIVKKTSMEAVHTFRNRSLDFVYIDADHNFPNVACDVFEWEKKVRPGGVVAGHDYFNTSPYSRNIVCHVKAVLQAYTTLFDIENWYVFDDERWMTWMWIKQ